MSVREKFPWAKFGFEGVLIVVSILAAFSIEEWRQGREDAEQERVLLEALAGDFEQAALSLEYEKAEHAKVAKNGEQIIRLADAGGVPESEYDQFQRMVGSHFGRALYKPPMGTVQTILGSGRIDLISNKQLVAELTKWSSAVDSLNALELEAREHFYDRVYPYLLARLNLKDLDRGYRDYLPEFPFEQRPVDAHLLIDDEEFIGIVYMHWVLKTNILTAIEPVEKSLDRIRTLVANELEDRF